MSSHFMEYPIPFPWQQWSHGTGLYCEAVKNTVNSYIRSTKCLTFLDFMELSLVHIYKFALSYTQENQNDCLSED